MNDQVMYHKARHASELELVNVLRKYGFINVRQSSEDEDCHHIDVYGDYNGKTYCFDAKDVKEKYRHTHNYNFSYKKEVLANPNRFKQHFIACKLYDDNSICWFVTSTLNAIKCIVNISSYDMFSVDKCKSLFDQSKYKLLKL